MPYWLTVGCDSRFGLMTCLEKKGITGFGIYVMAECEACNLGARALQAKHTYMIGHATFIGMVESLQVHIGNYISHRDPF